jgi:hypothetical protein
LSKWKLWNKSKGKKETITEVEPNLDHRKKPVEQPTEKTPEPENAPITEYNETLYSMNSSTKPQRKPDEEIKEPLKRTSWESPRTIEQNIDTMKKTSVESRDTCLQDDDIEKKVDQLLLKKKMKLQ